MWINPEIWQNPLRWNDWNFTFVSSFYHRLDTFYGYTESIKRKEGKGKSPRLDEFRKEGLLCGMKTMNLQEAIAV